MLCFNAEKLADYNIQIQHKTNNGYDKLYPMTLIENVVGNTGLKYEEVSYIGTNGEWAKSKEDLEKYKKTIRFSQPIKFMLMYQSYPSGAQANQGFWGVWGFYGTQYCFVVFPYITSWSFQYYVYAYENKIRYQICLKASQDSTTFYYRCYQQKFDSSISEDTLKIISNYASFDSANYKYSWYGFY